MDKKSALSERKRLSAIFASFAVLIVGTGSLLQSMSLDYYSVINTVEKIIPAAAIMGALGWVMGMVLDKPKTRRKVSYNSVFMNDVIRKDFAEETPANVEEQ